MNVRVNDCNLLFRRQFLVGPAPFYLQNSWRVTKFAELYVSTHPDLEINTYSAGQTDILCLGHVLDPNNILLDNKDVLKLLIDQVITFDNFEVRISSLGGRWVIFVKIGNEIRLYPDAAGTKSAFYVTQPGSTEVWVASQPRLLSEALGLPIDRKVLLDFLSGKYQNSWPGEITPYANVLQLLPNHFLDISSGGTRRFWPYRPNYELDLDKAAKDISSILYNTMCSARSRRLLALPLTGGYDSRAIFACARSIRQDVYLFTIYDPDTDYYDVVIPKKLAKCFNVKHHVLRTIPTNKAFLTLHKKNTSYMCRDPSDKKAYTFEKIPEHSFVLTGQIAEVARCFFYKNGIHPNNIDGEYLAKISGYEGNPVAIESFSNWLKSAPKHLGFNILDLFYWEHRLGNWAAMMATARDMTCDIIPPFNCRDILEIALSVNVQFRAFPYYLFRKICENAAPDMLSVPFNTSFIDSVNSLVKRIIPWRLWNIIYLMRMKHAGLAESYPTKNAMRELL
ncbi:MAG: hypothetical protein ACYDCJ_05110 [Gammaproteobacteria bacterium]